MPLRFGLELEFAISVAKPFDQWRRLINMGDSKLNLNLGTDHSPAKDRPRHLGGEFRTMIPWVHFPKKEVTFIVNWLDSEGAEITSTSGLHFHFSGVEFTPTQFNRCFRLLEAAKHWKTRKPWLDGGIGNRYAPLREVEQGHYECRVFNASNHYQGIYRPWVFLNRVIQDVLTME